MRNIIILAFSCCLIWGACKDTSIYTPKPRSFPRINYPMKSFKDFEENYCNFSFRMPAYFEIQKDTSFFEAKPENECWFNLYVEEFDCTLYCNYLEVGKNKSFDEIKTDAFNISDYHNKRATYIDELILQNEFGAQGIAFEIEGPVASHYQFYLTDSLQEHFFRASLYFNAQAKPDSLRPMLDFLKEDLDSIIYTFEWN
jgi:gliding motility-associated lipoprotein GldD